MLNRGNDGKKRGGGFTKLCSLSPALQEFVGASELARTEVNTITWLLSFHIYLALDVIPINHEDDNATDFFLAVLVCFQVVKKLWAYIRENNLQDQNNRRKILPDERLKKIFNVNSIDMFQMNKALTKHIWPLNSEGTDSLYTNSVY